ncbi:conserved hypothetical protein [Coccidioides posadasii str. Silveira]|uniref:Uncharacterized protein n=1 Tax=Coccidioides posadasii (strain RMSCC 757 / Silveira) TaxID=443226 RepID=E9DDK2_COCPS|nr:conserved hypothetical protein [Coccidioides posadasii str. Silveira]
MGQPGGTGRGRAVKEKTAAGPTTHPCSSRERDENPVFQGCAWVSISCSQPDLPSTRPSEPVPMRRLAIDIHYFLSGIQDRHLEYNGWAPGQILGPQAAAKAVQATGV